MNDLRIDAAFAVFFGGTCACPQHHAGAQDGTCGVRAADILHRPDGDIAVCLPCARCLAGVEFRAAPRARKRVSERVPADWLGLSVLHGARAA